MHAIMRGSVDIKPKTPGAFGIVMGIFIIKVNGVFLIKCEKETVLNFILNLS